MITTVKFNNPDELNATVSVTMKMSEWRALMRQLPRDWPSWRLASEIADVIAQAEKAFYAGEPPNDR